MRSSKGVDVVRFTMVDSQGEVIEDHVNAYVDMDCRIATVYGVMMKLDNFMEAYEGLASEYPRCAPSLNLWKLKYERDMHVRVKSYYDGLEMHELW